MLNTFIQISISLALLFMLIKPVGIYIAKVMNGENVFLSRLGAPLERLVYNLLGTSKYEEMNWKQYSLSMLICSTMGFAFVYALLMLQGALPLNPQRMTGFQADLAFNTAASFATNTNWQAYIGEASVSYLTQMLGLTVQNFLSAAAGIAALFAIIRGFTRTGTDNIGNFWVDMVRCILYVLLPLSLIVSLGLVSQGVVQNISPAKEVSLVEPIRLENGDVIDIQAIPMGPAASQISIKQLGTNGGGVFNANSAHPLENPTPLSNLLEWLSILLIPASLCYSFGYVVRDMRQGRALLAAMTVMFLLCLAVAMATEQSGTPQLSQQGMVDLKYSDSASGGNMEGKEVRFGIANSVLWAISTTAASNGSVNSMHDSYTPMGGMLLMLLIQLGEVVFGGVGSGLYGMLAFVILAVFVAGLMVGRTPEYLGKKIEPFEMKMASIVILIPPVLVLAGTACACLYPGISDFIGNKGAHGFSELLYAYSSAGNNNGSAFAGLDADNAFLNISLGIAMIIGRFGTMVPMLAVAGSFAQKRKVPASVGTLATHDTLFVGLLISVILIVGALSFFPALALGPIAEHLQMQSAAK